MTPISLGIHTVWSVFTVRGITPWVLSYPLRPQRRLIRLGGCWAHSHFVGFVISGSYTNMSKDEKGTPWSDRSSLIWVCNASLSQTFGFSLYKTRIFNGLWGHWKSYLDDNCSASQRPAGCLSVCASHLTSLLTIFQFYHYSARLWQEAQCSQSYFLVLYHCSIMHHLTKN